MIVAPDALAALPPGLVLVAGCFDPLHAGHLAYFEQARTFGPLCCAVASDAYIRTHKGRPPLLPQATRMALCDALCDFVIAQDESGEAGALEDLRPAHYAKGADWLHQIPEATLQACEQFGIPAVFLDAPVKDSSTARLHAYQHELDETAVARLEAFIAQQVPASKAWTPVTDYSFEARKAIEGIHPQLIKDVFRPNSVLDVGCGPGHLMRLLFDMGVDVVGVDIAAKADPYVRITRGNIAKPITGAEDDPFEWHLRRRADLVICREVLEHLTVKHIAVAVRNLVELSRKYVYVTTRFHPDPDSVLAVAGHDDLDPTHITLLSKPFLRALFVLEGCRSRPDLEALMDWQHKGRCLVFEVA